MKNEEKDFLESLFLKHYRQMESYAARFFSSRDLARDVVQETFLVAQIKIDALMASPSPQGWLFNTLKNVIGNTYKQQQRLASIVPLDECNLSSDMPLSVSATYQNMIPQEDLELLIWVYCDGEPYAEAAKRLGISLSACKKRIQRAKLKLKEALEEKT